MKIHIICSSKYNTNDYNEVVDFFNLSKGRPLEFIKEQGFPDPNIDVDNVICKFYREKFKISKKEIIILLSDKPPLFANSDKNVTKGFREKGFGEINLLSVFDDNNNIIISTKEWVNTKVTQPKYLIAYIIMATLYNFLGFSTSHHSSSDFNNCLNVDIEYDNENRIKYMLQNATICKDCLDYNLHQRDFLLSIKDKVLTFCDRDKLLEVKKIFDDSESNMIILERFLSVCNEIKSGVLKLEQELLPDDEDKIIYLISEGENQNVEFKETFSKNVREKRPDEKKGEDKGRPHDALRAIVGFLNSGGGSLLIGVSDNGEIKGIEDDTYGNNSDLYIRHFNNALKERIGVKYLDYIKPNLITVTRKQILYVRCNSSAKECFLDDKEFYIRINAETKKLEGTNMSDYIKRHFKS